MGFGRIAAPLTRFLQKDGFNWSEEASQAMDQLKITIKSMLVLALPNIRKPFTIEVDAPCTVVRAFLSQKARPIAFYCKAFSKSAWQKPMYEKKIDGNSVGSTKMVSLPIKESFYCKK